MIKPPIPRTKASRYIIQFLVGRTPYKLVERLLCVRPDIVKDIALAIERSDDAEDEFGQKLLDSVAVSVQVSAAPTIDRGMAYSLAEPKGNAKPALGPFSHHVIPLSDGSPKSTLFLL